MRQTPLLIIPLLLVLGPSPAGESPVVVVEDGPIELPKDGRVISQRVPKVTPIVVDVREAAGQQAAYAIDGQPISLPALIALLDRAREREPTQEVVINGDPLVRWDQVAAVMHACATARITRVSAKVAVGAQPEPAVDGGRPSAATP